MTASAAELVPSFIRADGKEIPDIPGLRAKILFGGSDLCTEMRSGVLRDRRGCNGGTGAQRRLIPCRLFRGVLAGSGLTRNQIE
jgi:hypothetical protein